MEALSVVFGASAETKKMVSIPLFHTFWDATSGHGKSEGMKACILRFNKEHPDWTILVLDTNGEYSNLGHPAPICFVQTTEPLDIKGLLEPIVGAGMMYYLDKIIEEATFDTLGEIQRNIEKKMLQAEKGELKINGKELGKLRVINHLLKKLVPLVERAGIEKDLLLKPGINVMDLRLKGVTDPKLRTSYQQLIVRSVFLLLRQGGEDETLRKILVIADEAHRWIPQRYSSIVKQPFSELVSEGRKWKIFVWMADQALTKVDKEPLKPVKVWIIGQQMQEAELIDAEEAVGNITELEVTKKDIKSLAPGDFIIADGILRMVFRAYLVPYEMPEEIGIKVATGQLDRAKAWTYYVEKAPRLQKPKPEPRTRPSKITPQTPKLERKEVPSPEPPPSPSPTEPDQARLLEHVETIYNIHHTQKSAQLTTENPKGQIMFVVLNDLEGRGGQYGDINAAMLEHGWNIPKSSVFARLSDLVSQGLLVMEGKPARYRPPTKVKINVVKE